MACDSLGSGAACKFDIESHTTIKAFRGIGNEYHEQHRSFHGIAEIDFEHDGEFVAKQIRMPPGDDWGISEKAFRKALKTKFRVP